jgi:molecular chaperone GrpE
MTLNEPWATRDRLRDALAEAAASYASAEAAARDAARAEATPGDQSLTGVDDATLGCAGRPAPTAAEQAPVIDATTEDDRHAARLRTVAAERDQYLDHLQRLKAEFENYRKRVQRDHEALVLSAGEGVIESLLPVVDNLQRALEPAERPEEGRLLKGVELVAGQLRSVLEGHGLDEVPAAPGLLFDPNVHEAVVAQESDDYSEGMISAVLEPGYLLHGRLLRPARVIVAG